MAITTAKVLGYQVGAMEVLKKAADPITEGAGAAVGDIINKLINVGTFGIPALAFAGGYGSQKAYNNVTFDKHALAKMHEIQMLSKANNELAADMAIAQNKKDLEEGV